MYNLLERNKTNENHDNKNVDSHSYILIKNKNNYISSIKDEDNKLIVESKNGIKDESNNNFYESNVIFNMTENVLNHTPTNEEKKSQKLSESLPAEELFIKQKDKIKQYKEILEKEKKNVYKNDNSFNNDNEQKEIVNENKKNISLEDFNFFEITSFIYNRDSKIKENRIPVFKANNWKRLNEPKYNFDLKNIALRTSHDIDYRKKMAKITIDFTLKEESELWIFTRCFMKNESVNININNSSFNNDIDKIFNKYTSVIKIIKKRDSNKSLITFGTFCENMKQVSYKSFLKRQLVNFNEVAIYQQTENENDSCDFKLYITDKGDDCIDAKVSMNSDNKYNQIIAKFFLPTDNKSKILFCGEGDGVIIKDLNISHLDKNEELEEGFETLFSFEQKSCNCCNII